MLRCLVLAFTGDQAADIGDEAAPERAHNVATTSLQAPDHARSWQDALLPGTFQVQWSAGL